MWLGPIHDPDFVKRVVKHVEDDPSRYGTHARMKGMLGLAAEVGPRQIHSGSLEIDDFDPGTRGTVLLHTFSTGQHVPLRVPTS